MPSTNTFSLSDTLSAAAIALAELGFPVFRSRPHDKPPLRTGWQVEATSDPAQVATLWAECPAANVSLACGRNAWVLDVDGDEGKASLRRLLERHGMLPPVPLSRTGSGGFHLFFAADPRIRNSVRRLGPALDTRSIGGLVVLPPSIHPDGASYRWLRDPWSQPILPAPAWLIELLDPPKPAEIPPQPIRLDHQVSAYARRALENELSAIANSRAPARGPDGRKIPGTQHETMFHAAIKLGSLVGAGLLAEQATRELLLQEACARGIAKQRASQTIRAGMAWGIAHPREVAR